MILIVSVIQLLLRPYLSSMGTIQEEFGARIRELRIKCGWTQEQLANAAGRHWTYIGGIERGERNITLQVAADLASALGVNIGELFHGLGQDRTNR